MSLVIFAGSQAQAWNQPNLSIGKSSYDFVSFVLFVKNMLFQDLGEHFLIVIL